MSGHTERPLPRDRMLVLVDRQGRVRGLAMASHAQDDPIWRRALGWRRGLDGYLPLSPDLDRTLAIVEMAGDGPIRVGTLTLP